MPADLLDSDLDVLTAGVEGVFHCAALSSPWGKAKDFQAINVDVTRRLLVSARNAGCQRFVFVSSPSVYACEADQFGLKEDDPINSRPLNDYARTKAEAEAFVLREANAGMSCVTIRPRAIIGPDDEVLLPRFLRLIGKGRFPLVRRGAAEVELTDVRDVVAALLTAYDRAEALSGEVINISGGRSICVRDMVDRLGNALGRTVRFTDLPYGFLRAVAEISERVCGLLPGRPEPLLTVYSLATLSFSQTFDLAKAHQLLDYTPQYDAVETALHIARQAHGR
ncbi:hypothetical protein ABENE_15675 [Asticcacaulis benevestitus DSM 16100 = ATCC BAA-896]|uniref:NAD-dependent epimerase/dehydratase domain-containing protein n=2 Tax=Asticcacaulis TaxID=76890 RepID=V4PT32_9CAUL|nr:hypothetical protein ABENE_15675 [Asticcacaulis benevestitus DSM 16100 = ATCC BAA-896]